MPDFVSRKKIKKKVLDRWEKEGGQSAVGAKKSSDSNPPPKRKRKKDRQRQSMDAV